MPATNMKTLIRLGPLLFLLAGCTGQSPDQRNYLFTQLNPAEPPHYQQLNGSQPAQWIVDVKSTGMALLDLNGDGDLALLLTCGSNLDRWNQGMPSYAPLLFSIDDQLNLVPIDGAAGIPALKWTSGCAAADIDGDGDDDLLLTGIDGSLLLENHNGSFRPFPNSGIETASWCTSASFADLDLDGDLDVYLCRYLDFPFDSPPQHGEDWSCLWENMPVLCGPRGLSAAHDLVFENLGDGKFIDRTVEWGFENARPGYGLAVTIVNLFGSPYPEIFVANDSCPNHLWIRQEDGTWVEDGLLSGLGVDQDGQEQAGMGIAVAGILPPTGLDLAVTNFERESVNLYANEGEGIFRDVAAATGIAGLTRSTLGWGVGIADFNLDGLPDIFISNGHVYPQADSAEVSPGYAQYDQLFLGERQNTQKLYFKESNALIRHHKKNVGRCLILADLDSDGDIDAISSTLNGSPLIYRNNTDPYADTTKRSVSIKLKQSGFNTEAIGSTVRVLENSQPFEIPVIRQSSFQSSGYSQVIFPLTGSGNLHHVQVKWTDGSMENFPITGRVEILQKGTGKKP